MSSLSTRIVFSAKDSGASSAFSRLAKKSSQAQRKVFGLNSAFKGTNNALKGMNLNLGRLGGGLGIGALFGRMVGTLKEITSLNIDFQRIQNTLNAVTGSAKLGAQEFDFLGKEANRLGLRLRPLAESYASLLASTKLLGFSSKDTQEIFSSFSEALTAFGAGREQTIRVFQAISQIASKGVVSSEELRQQLGEALPGALQLAAKSMKMTDKEFNKLLASGKILSKDFLKPFAKQIRESLGAGAITGAELLNAKINVLSNSYEELLMNLGKELDAPLKNIIMELTELVKDKQFQKNVSDIMKTFIEGGKIAFSIFKQLFNILKEITSSLGGIGSIGLATALAGGVGSGALRGVGGALGIQQSRRAFSGSKDLDKSFVRRQEWTASQKMRYSYLDNKVLEKTIKANTTTMDKLKGVMQKSVSGFGKFYGAIFGLPGLIATAVGSVLVTYASKQANDFVQEQSVRAAARFEELSKKSIIKSSVASREAFADKDFERAIKNSRDVIKYYTDIMSQFSEAGVNLDNESDRSRVFREYGITLVSYSDRIKEHQDRIKEATEIMDRNNKVDLERLELKEREKVLSQAVNDSLQRMRQNFMGSKLTDRFVKEMGGGSIARKLLEEFLASDGFKALDGVGQTLARNEFIAKAKPLVKSMKAYEDSVKRQKELEANRVREIELSREKQKQILQEIKSMKKERMLNNKYGGNQAIIELIKLRDKMVSALSKDGTFSVTDARLVSERLKEQGRSSLTNRPSLLKLRAIDSIDFNSAGARKELIPKLLGTKIQTEESKQHKESISFLRRMTESLDSIKEDLSQESIRGVVFDG